MPPKKSKREPNKPDLPQQESLTCADKFSVDEGSSHETQLFETCSLEDAAVSHVTFRECILHNANLAAGQFDYFEIIDAIIDRCDLANSQWKRLRATRLRFRNCRLLGFRANEAEMLDVAITDSQLQFAQFRFSKLSGIWFENCNLQNADFSGSDLTGATFANCDLTGASFTKSTCKGLDLRSSLIDGLIVGPTEFIGAIINPMQAAEVIKAFGVQVLNEHEELPEVA